jgi:hypothetical protein
VSAGRTFCSDARVRKEGFSLATTVESNWEKFKRDFLAGDTPSLQLLDMKLAFFAGAQAMYDSFSLDIAAFANDEAGRELKRTGEELDRSARVLVAFRRQCLEFASRCISRSHRLGVTV